MRFCDKLIQLRAEKGISQEGLANELDVSRQAVSKWEAGMTMPELAKLIAMADMFGTSVDYLVRDEMEEREPQSKDDGSAVIAEQIAEITNYMKRRERYEYKSATTVFGIPLVHVHFSRGNGFCVAKGIIAVGNVAIGAIAVGGFSLGLVAFGGLSLGLLLALGGLSAGLLAVGGIALGGIALGGMAFGIYAMGGMAVASELALGGIARAHVAAGGMVDGTHTLVVNAASEAQIYAFLREHCPYMKEWLIRLLAVSGKM